MSDSLKEYGRIILFSIGFFGTLIAFFSMNFPAMFICFGIFIISVVLLIIASLNKKKKKHQDELQAHQMKLNNQIPVFESFGSHVNGLPIPTEMQIKLTVFREMIFLNNIDTVGGKKQFGAFEFRIPIEKLISMDVATQSQIEYIQKQSLSCAVVGALLFGDIGALLGGMPRTQAVEHTEKFFVISYESTNGIQLIVLKLPKPENAILSIKQYIPFKQKIVEL